MPDIFKLMEESKSLEPRLFSLIRIKILHSLHQLWPEGAAFREFSSCLAVQDGLLYSNLGVLTEMGLVRSEKVEVAGKRIESYYLTDHGKEEWSRALDWLGNLISGED